MSTIKTTLRFLQECLTNALVLPAFGIVWVLTRPRRCAAELRERHRVAQIRQCENDVSELNRQIELWKLRRDHLENSARQGVASGPLLLSERRYITNMVDALTSQREELLAHLAELRQGAV